MNSRYKAGLLMALLTALISGFSLYFNGLVVKGIDPLVHTTIKNVVAGLLIGAVLLRGRQWGMVRTLSKSQWKGLLLVALIGGSISFALFFTGLQMIGGTQGNFIHKTLVLWVLLLAVPLLKEKVNWKLLLGVGLVYGSTVVAGLPTLTNLSIGHGLVLLATMMWALEHVIAKRLLTDLPSNIVVAARMMVGSVILVGISLVMGRGAAMLSLPVMTYVQLAGLGVMLFLYVMTWYRALKWAEVTHVAAVLSLSVVVTTLINWVTSGAVGFVQVGQMVLVVSGVYWVVLAAKDNSATNSEQSLLSQA